jgi:hypothetical protein
VPLSPAIVLVFMLQIETRTVRPEEPLARGLFGVHDGWVIALAAVVVVGAVATLIARARKPR